MLLGVLCILVVPQVFSEAPPAPPQDIQVDNWLLRWSPDPDHGNVTYTAQYSSFDSCVWTDVPYCVHTSLNSCNVSSIKARSEYGCVMLRVQAERHGQKSPSVQACSTHGHLCTPDFILTASPGSLTVHLSRNTTFLREHADHAKYRVYYGKKGEALQGYKDGPASVTIDELQEGQRYCTRVQYLYFTHTEGLPTCTQCALIPESDSRRTVTIVSLVLVGVLLLVFPVIAYFLLFQRWRLKRWLQPLYTFREHLLVPLPEPLLPIPSSTEEHYDVITSMFPVELRE
ncbi:interferon gamma receptor 2 isoform X1 [Pseudochaenichthys georgianus]|uniref:interferon gamma receptor 2 isoform X1 n=1 Tax=Pseudochaenichthys georgianus TaxID=52239 RepID=UPI00146F0DA0|nr:interferon gamma receptor 2 isoform X1 [Pseudochaenichthys georgianus]